MLGTYISPAETGFYYLQSRYYDAEIGRFLNADGLVATGQGENGYNMFAYCGNNPINRIDSSGMKWWDSVKNFCAKNWGRIKTWANKTFGREHTSSVTESKQIIPDPSPLVISTGDKTTKIDKKKNNTNPVIGYTDNDMNNGALTSTIGAKFNISSATIDVCLGFKNIGIVGSYTDKGITKSLGLRLDISELKFGMEGATTVQWDNDISNTTFVNVSFSAIGIMMAYAFVNGYSPAYAMQN